MAQWRILRGIHADSNTTLVSEDAEAMNGIDRQEGIFYRGDIIETDANLEKLNAPPEIKFEKVQAPKAYAELDGMTVAELHEVAEKHEIELPGNLKKSQVVAALRAKLEYQAAVS